MRLAGIDDALELRIRKEAIGDDIGRKMWPIGAASAARRTPWPPIEPAESDAADTAEMQID